MKNKERPSYAVNVGRQCHEEIGRLAKAERTSHARIVKRAITAYIVLASLNEEARIGRKLEVRA
jgi:hypothetical protein